MTDSSPLDPARSAPARIPVGDRPPDAARPIRVIAVTSGKGGVGKTTVAINLSTAIASLGKGVTLMDADLGLANARCRCWGSSPSSIFPMCWTVYAAWKTWS